MAIHFHSLAIKEITRQTADCISITFDVPEALKKEFAFTHGQNITVKAIIDGEELRRSYSICSSPFENELMVAVKKMDGGKFSTYANEQLQKGNILEVLPPTGKFNTALHPFHKKNYLAFAAGSGITPIISIIKTTLQTEPESNFTLIFNNRNKASIIFFEELEAIKNKYLRRFNLVNILSRERTDAAIFSGRLDKEKLVQLKKLVNYSVQDEYFICGPEKMIFCVRDFLEELGIDKRKIHFELFTTPGVKKEKGPLLVKPESDQSSDTTVELKLDGRTISFKMTSPTNSILDEALKQGADLPFACKGGVCCTCKAKLVAGEVEMDVNWGLEQEEVAKGFILTCQSHPSSEKVVIDFDAR